MLRKIPRLLWLALPLAFFLYFFHLGGIGMLGPDEPRYASISREMARSGDWITPRLWGEPWFEKPALLYWISGAAFKLGLPPDLAPRLPVALLSVAFLVFYWWILSRELGCRIASLSTLILGTTVAWIAFSQVGVTDLPMTVTFSAAMLLALPWIERGETRWLPAASALLGFAVMAKFLLPLVLAAPLAMRSRNLRDLLRLRVIAPFVIVTAPWYTLVYLRNGRPFLQTFWDHQFGRLTTGAMQHSQRWWFYVPCLLGLLIPWTPLLALLRRRLLSSPGRWFLFAWALFGFIFFSIARNKLPGYLLPLLPAIAALLGIALHEARDPRIALACSALLLIVFPIAVPFFPAAVANLWSLAPPAAFHWTWLVPIAVAAAAWTLDARGRRIAAVFSIAAACTAGFLYLRQSTADELNRIATAEPLWIGIAPRAAEVCIAGLHRNWQYGLNYYSIHPLPECSADPRPLRLVQRPGWPPSIDESRAP